MQNLDTKKDLDTEKEIECIISMSQKDLDMKQGTWANSMPEKKDISMPEKKMYPNIRGIHKKGMCYAYPVKVQKVL